MISIADIAQKMLGVLGNVAGNLAQQVGFVRRPSKMTGKLFVRTLVLGWLSRPEATLDQLAQTAALEGVQISRQGLDDRFTPEAANLLRQTLDAAITHLVAADPVAIPVLQRFSAVLVQDSTTISLPDALAQQWSGCGGANGQGEAALKLQVRWDLLSGSLEGLLLEDGRASDRATPLQKQALPEQVLRVADLGYFSQDDMVKIEGEGAYFLSMLHARVALYDEEGKRLEASAILPETTEVELDRAVWLGARQRLRVRFLAVRVPPKVAAERRRRIHAEARRRGKTAGQARLQLADWTVILTNVPVVKLSVPEALVLMRLRWQIELLFKLWKQDGKVDEWRSAKPYRILCEIYAKLIGLVLQHWIFLAGCWRQPNRSMVKAAQTVRWLTPLLIIAMAGHLDINVALTLIAATIGYGCKMDRRQQQPHAYQLALDVVPPASCRTNPCAA